MLLFWAMFLPLGTRWSIDSRRRPPPPQESLASVATMAILLQMSFMYLFTGISKFNDVWFSGAALGIGFSIDRVTRPLGHWLTEFPGLTAQISRGTLVAELLLPFVLFSPWKSNWCRSIALLMLIAFHIGIEATMVVVMFSYASLAGLTLFIPTFWWNYSPLKQVQSVLNRVFPVPPQPARRSSPATSTTVTVTAMAHRASTSAACSGSGNHRPGALRVLLQRDRELRVGGLEKELGGFSEMG